MNSKHLHGSVSATLSLHKAIASEHQTNSRTNYPLNPLIHQDVSYLLVDPVRHVRQIDIGGVETLNRNSIIWYCYVQIPWGHQAD